MPISKTCERCEKTFNVRPRDNSQRFCSRDCKIIYEADFGRVGAHKPETEFKCATCTKPFSMKPGAVRAYQNKWGKLPLYCSTGCGGIGRRLPESAWQVTCIQCNELMPIQRKPGGTVNRQKRLCSTKCRSEFRRLAYQRNHPDQKPTKRITKNGYVRVVVPGISGRPSRDVFEHRYVMEQHLGRELYPDETVHHRDGNRQHNALENLELFSSRHGPGQRVVDKIDFALEIIQRYPDFAKIRGFVLQAVDPLPSVP